MWGARSLRATQPFLRALVLVLRRRNPSCVLRVAWAARDRSLFSQSFPYRGDSLLPGLMLPLVARFQRTVQQFSTSDFGPWTLDFPRAAAGDFAKPTSQ